LTPSIFSLSGTGIYSNLASTSLHAITLPIRAVEAKLHDESTMIQRCFDDNNDDNKRL